MKRTVRYALTFLAACAVMAGAADASGLINGGKIMPGTITEKQIKPHSLTARSFKEPLPAGAPGRPGRDGATGASRRTGRCWAAGRRRRCWAAGRRRCCWAAGRRRCCWAPWALLAPLGRKGRRGLLPSGRRPSRTFPTRPWRWATTPRSSERRAPFTLKMYCYPKPWSSGIPGVNDGADYWAELEAITPTSASRFSSGSGYVVEQDGPTLASVNTSTVFGDPVPTSEADGPGGEAWTPSGEVLRSSGRMSVSATTCTLSNAKVYLWEA